MDIYKQRSKWKWYLALAGMVIIAISMLYTKYLTDQLAEEENKKAEQLKRATESLSFSFADTSQCDVTFQMEFLESNTSIPVLWVDEFNVPLDARNFGEHNDTSTVFREEKFLEFKEKGIEPSIVETPYGNQYLYYEHSFILTLLRFYPFVQLILIAAFIGFGYAAFSTSRRAEQNRVWAGMAKETAHQLGTPISGIVAWIEHLRLMREDDADVKEILDELEKDVSRLDLVADRFSKIGSAPELKEVNIYDEMEKCRAYMQRRAPRKVMFDFPNPESSPIPVKINAHLFVWVIENLLRNSLDAMGNTGKISAEISADEKFVTVNLSDTGHGIAPGKIKTVFQPGYSTKKRGWGLGLSLAKRIIEDYHSGRIFVKKSAIDEGTTFTIQLPK